MLPNKISVAVSVERLLGAELARAAQKVLARSAPDPVERMVASPLANLQALLALHWELQHRAAETHVAEYGSTTPWGPTEIALGWLSALLCAGPPVADPVEVE